ncbi:uncharacterized protein C16orf90 homolog [Phacochoerus africanus]|uniref:uncharacterized protein C16orf90 homolog n=1 Tax=Phacochoerus africanus TaxID=41426 RepID=UPI001FD88104|nr:uncharacterized protein C16orf90 homolog [Phacochoerus africanus]
MKGLTAGRREWAGLLPAHAQRAQASRQAGSRPGSSRAGGCPGNRVLSGLEPTDAVSWARGRPGHPDTPPNIYEGGLGAQQQPQCPRAQGSKPKNFRLRHLRGLALYLPGHVQFAGQCESHWLGRLMAWGCFSQPEGMAWPLDLPQGNLGPGISHCSVLLEAQLPRGSLGNIASSSSMDSAKGVPSQPSPPEGLGLRPKRSWGASEESTCPLCKRTRSGALERP